MTTHDESIPVTRAAPALRGDVLSARSRMRTKYGSQRQILEVSEQLTPDETLRLMAVANGPSQPDRHNHGLLALTSRRLIFVPKSSACAAVDIALDQVRALLWTKAGRTGTLSVLGEGVSSSFNELSAPDGRELMAVAVQLNPLVKRIGHL